MNRLAMLLLCVTIGPAALLAQSKDYQLTFTSGDTLSHVTLVSLSSDTLTILHEGMSGLIMVGSIKEIRLVRESDVWEVAKHYGLVSGVAGGIVSAIVIAVSAHGGSFYSLGVSNSTAKIYGAFFGGLFYGAVFVILGGIAGTIAGISQGTDEVYDLSDMPLKGKIVTVHEILSSR